MSWLFLDHMCHYVLTSTDKIQKKIEPELWQNETEPPVSKRLRPHVLASYSQGMDGSLPFGTSTFN